MFNPKRIAFKRRLSHQTVFSVKLRSRATETTFHLEGNFNTRKLDYITRADAALVLSMYVVDGYSNFKKFSISFWYKRTDGKTSLQGLFTNGDCETDPSILIMSEPDSLGVRLETKSHSIREDGINVRTIR